MSFLCARPVSCSRHGCVLLLWMFIPVHVHGGLSVIVVHCHVLACRQGRHCSGCMLLVVVVWRKEAMSQVVTMASCLYSHVRSHIRLMCISYYDLTCGILTCPMQFCWMFHGFCKILTESGGTRYRITRHNNKNTIPVTFYAQSSRMSNSRTSPAEFQDSSGIPGGIPGESKDLTISGILLSA